MSKLAIQGGAKVVSSPLPHYKWPVITTETKEAVLKQLDESISIYDKSGIIDTLEKRLASYHGIPKALLTSTGTTALYSLFAAAGIQEGDEVICPTYTFFATATPLFYLGAIPILIDAQENGNIDPNKIEEKINPKTKAILVTHMWGIPCDMDPICALAKKYQLSVLEDGSHAHGAIYRKRKVGTFGQGAAFSLQGQKTLTGGEGGFLLTCSDELYYRALLFGHYNKRCLQEIPKDHEFYEFGTTGMGLKLRIHPLAAAIANQQLDTLDDILQNRRNMASIMRERLIQLPGIKIPPLDPHAHPAWYAFLFHLDPAYFSPVSLSQLHEAFMAEGCKELDRPKSTSPLHLLPLFQRPSKLHPKYKNAISYKIGDFPCAEKFYRTAFKLPVWHQNEHLPIAHQYLDAIEKVLLNYKELI